MTGLARLHHGHLTVVAATFDEVEPVVRMWLADEEPAVVAVERFVITRNTAKKTQQLDALKLSGVLENLVVQGERHIIAYQNMSDAKKIGHPTLLRSLHWKSVGKHATHKNDAAAQVIMMLASRYPVAFNQLVTPDIV
jgi:hypothetical protein